MMLFKTKTKTVIKTEYTNIDGNGKKTAFNEEQTYKFITKGLYIFGFRIMVLNVKKIYIGVYDLENRRAQTANLFDYI